MRRIFITNGFVIDSTVDLTARVLFGNDVFYRKVDVETEEGYRFGVVYVAENDCYVMEDHIAEDIVHTFMHYYEEDLDCAFGQVIEDDETQFRLLFDTICGEFTLSGFVVSE